MIFFMLGYIFKNHNKCKHPKITPFSVGKFCPDCGKEIQISWLILRCSCCQSKRRANVVFNNLVPRDKYCIKCGNKEYFKENKEKIDFFELEYSAISKKEINANNFSKEILQIWIEQDFSPNNIVHTLKLLPLLVR